MAAPFPFMMRKKDFVKRSVRQNNLKIAMESICR